MNNVSLLLDFDTDLSQELIEGFVKELSSFLSKYEFKNQSISFEFKLSNKGRIRVSELPVKDVLNNLSSQKKSFSFGGKKYLVKMNSQRYFMFKENSRCVCCGLVGTRMFLEYYLNDMIPHFNLYGQEDDDLILMTKDHITAKAHGGEDRHSNYQTMCSTCNSLKGHASLTLESLKILRRLFDGNKLKMTKKQIHYFLEECKNQLSKKEKKSNTQVKKHSMVLNCDVACFLDNKGNMYGRHIYEKTVGERIGCMKKGTYLDPILEYKGEIVCSVGENSSIRLLKNYLSAS